MKTLIAAIALALSAPLAAPAADLSYSYVEGGWYKEDVDNAPRADGWQVAGSGAITDNIHAFGGYTRASADGAMDLEGKSMHVGLGWNTRVGNSSDLVVRAAWLRNELDRPFDISRDGVQAEVGLRSGLGEHLETYVAAAYRDISADSDFFARLGAQYKFTPSFGLVANVDWDGDGQTYFVGPRLTF